MKPKAKNLTTLVIVSVVSICFVEILYLTLGHLITDDSETDFTPNNYHQTLAIKLTGQNRQTDAAVIIQRNIFNAVIKTPDGAPKGPAMLDGLDKNAFGLVLLGTIEGTGNTNRAIILHEDSSEQKMYRVGDQIGNGRISGISRKEVNIEIGGKIYTMPIHRESSKDSSVYQFQQTGKTANAKEVKPEFRTPVKKSDTQQITKGRVLTVKQPKMTSENINKD